MDKNVYIRDRADLQSRITKEKEKIRKTLGEMEIIKAYLTNNDFIMKMELRKKIFCEAMEQRLAYWPRGMRVYTSVGNMFVKSDVISLYQIFTLDLYYRMGQIDYGKRMASQLVTDWQRFDDHVQTGFKTVANLENQLKTLDQLHKDVGGSRYRRHV